MHIRVGVLALQSAFIEHIEALKRLVQKYPSKYEKVIVVGVDGEIACVEPCSNSEALTHPTANSSKICLEVCQVRTPDQLSHSYLDGLIIPGGESTTMSIAANRLGLWTPLHEWVCARRPTLGTCAGLILLSSFASSQKEGGQALLAGLDVEIDRNYYGRQGESFQHRLTLYDSNLVGPHGDAACTGVFIRAPFILDPKSSKVLATLPKESRPDRQWTQDPIVAVQQDAFIGLAFHPELIDSDLRWHDYFIDLVVAKKLGPN